MFENNESRVYDFKDSLRQHWSITIYLSSRSTIEGYPVASFVCDVWIDNRSVFSFLTDFLDQSHEDRIDFPDRRDVMLAVINHWTSCVSYILHD